MAYRNLKENNVISNLMLVNLTILKKWTIHLKNTTFKNGHKKKYHFNRSKYRNITIKDIEFKIKTYSTKET